MVPSVCTLQTRIDALADSVAEAEERIVGNIGNGSLDLAEDFIIDPKVTVNTRVFISRKKTGSVSGHLYYQLEPGVGVYVYSTAPADFSPFSYQIFH
jgi:hypothetical protein